MSTQSGPLGIRLFLEGVEVPVVAAQVSGAPSSPATAAIQIVPTDLAFLFLPRTLVHLFYLEELLTEEDILIAAQLEAREAERIDRFDVADERYRLMYSGEIVGFAYAKTTNQRSFVLQCLDLSSYWDACMQWFADWSVGGNALTDQTHSFVGAGQGLFDNVAGGTKWVIGKILTSKPTNPDYKNAKGLLGGMIHLLETVGGVRPRARTFAGKRGVNDFFTIAELRYNLSGQIGAVEADTTSSQVYDTGAFFSWLQNGMQSLGNLISFRDILRNVGQYVFHDVYPNPAARFIRGKETKVSTTTANITQTVEVEVVILPPEAEALVEKAKNAIQSAQTNYTNAAGAPDARGRVQLSLAEGVDLVNSAVNGLQKALDVLAAPGTHPKGATIAITIQGAISDLGSFQRTVFTTTAELGTPEVFRDTGTALGFAYGTLKTIHDVAQELQSQTHTATQRVVEEKEGDHLFTQLLLPEAYFAAPPKCNVIFPDQYTELNYSRNFLREVSRLALYAGSGIIGTGDAKLLGRYYVAPNIADAQHKLVRNAFQFAARIILPHEVHSGIIPKIEWVTQGHRWGIKAGQARNQDNELDRKVGYLQRLANFHFFLNRWAARSMNVTMRFNPRIVLGLPAVVLDRSSPAPAVLESVTRILGSERGALPTAFLGKVVGFEHNVNQQTGTTQLAFSQCRTHRGQDDEFLSVLVRDKTAALAQKIYIRPKKIASFAADGIEPNDSMLKMLTKYMLDTLANAIIAGLGKVTKVEMSTNKVAITRGDAELLRITDTLYASALSSQEGSVVADAFLNGEAVPDLQLPELITVSISATINEGRFIASDTSISPEKLMIPGWYAPAWHPENISEQVYGPLLGCAAITGDPEISSDAAFLRLLRTLFDSHDESAAVEDDQNTVTEVSKRDGFVSVNADGTVTEFNFGDGGVEKAIDSLILMYGILKKRGLDVQRFIHEFTYRPVASLTEVLGSSSLEFDGNGNVVGDGVEGFHSRAFGDYNTNVRQLGQDPGVSGTQRPSAIPGDGALANLVPKDQKSKFNKTTFDETALGDIPPELDPRGRARQRVLTYLEELKLSRGLLGS